MPQLLHQPDSGIFDLGDGCAVAANKVERTDCKWPRPIGYMHFQIVRASEGLEGSMRRTGSPALIMQAAEYGLVSVPDRRLGQDWLWSHDCTFSAQFSMQVSLLKGVFYCIILQGAFLASTSDCVNVSTSGGSQKWTTRNDEGFYLKSCLY